MISNKYTGPGVLYIEILTEANVRIKSREFLVSILNSQLFQVYTIGAEDVPNLVTSKAEILTVGPYISYA